MILQENPLLSTSEVRELARDVQGYLRAAFRKVNAMASGRAMGTDGAATAPPTTGDWALGDYVTNSAPAELGVATQKYVIRGWICTAAGSPGTWVQCRTLTGA